jgi:hypothetical protein
MRTLLVVLGWLVAGCGSNGGNASPDLSVPSDLATPQFELSGTYAGQLVAQANFDGGGIGTLTLDTLMVAFFTPSADGTTAGVSIDWHPCGVNLPGNLALPYAYVLEPLQVEVANAGTLSARGDGAQFTSTTTNVAVGWCPSMSASEPLPAVGAPLCPPPNGSDPNVCHYATQKPCVYQTTDATPTTYPGVPVQTSGLNPDADVIYVDLQLGYSVQATVTRDQLTGTPTMVSATWNVLACHLRAGGSCSPTQVAQLNAQKPQLTFAGGTFKAHIQPQYYTCPLFMADVGDALNTFDPLDGGVPDGGITGMSFPLIQRDLDAMGCATCHDDPDGPSRLHLVYKPWNQSLLRRNYEALLPFTKPSTAHGKLGGRFVNGKAPVPDWMKQRWINWVAAGARF